MACRCNRSISECSSSVAAYRQIAHIYKNIERTEELGGFFRSKPMVTRVVGCARYENQDRVAPFTRNQGCCSAMPVFCLTYLNHFPLKSSPHCGEGRAFLLGDPSLFSHSGVQRFRSPNFGLQLTELCPPGDVHEKHKSGTTFSFFCWLPFVEKHMHGSFGAR